MSMANKTICSEREHNSLVENEAPSERINTYDVSKLHRSMNNVPRILRGLTSNTSASRPIVQCQYKTPQNARK